MMFWFSSDENIHVSEVVLEIETTKADINKVEIELNKLKEKEKITKIAINQFKENLSFLRKEAIIVSIKEYKQSSYRLGGLHEDVISINRDIAYLNKLLEAFKERLEKLEKKKKQVKFRLLEFKKR